MKLPFKQPKPEDEAEKKPVMSDEVRAAFFRAAMDACNAANRRPEKREEVWINTGGGWQPARTRINLGRPW